MRPGGVRVPSMAQATTDPAVSAAIADWSRTLEGRGRVVVRPSGTEPYIRVMVEGESAAEIERAADEIAAAIEKLQ